MDVGAAISELPFEPRGTSGLTCRDCHSKSKSINAGSSDQSDKVRPRVEGNWTCSGCGGVITSLPFTPRDTNNLMCTECYKKSKAV